MRFRHGYIPVPVEVAGLVGNAKDQERGRKDPGERGQWGYGLLSRCSLRLLRLGGKQEPTDYPALVLATATTSWSGSVASTTRSGR